MVLLVLSVSLLVFFVTIILFYNLARNSDSKRRRLKSITGTYKNDIDDELEKSFIDRLIIPILKSIMKNLSNSLPKSKKSNEIAKTEKNLKSAGISLSVNEYNAARLMISGGFIFVSFVLTAFFPIGFNNKILIVLFSGLISVVIPIFYVRNRINSRQMNIRNQLPEIMDLLSVAIEAGLGFDAALVKIGERLKGALVDELNIVLIEIQLGKPRKDALKSLSDRSSLEELKTFLSSIIQAEQLGIPIKNVLYAQAKQLRVTRRQIAEEKAMKAPIKMMIPMVLFIFPVLFIILLGPSVIEMMEKMR
jgi:tight adherence protein C